LTPPPPGITFTFTNDASVEVAEVGETIDYTYCGENTSDVPLEVIQVDDDRFGLLTVPEEQTIVEPGETLCSTDLGLPVSYVATEADVGTTIVNNAVVTARTVGAEPQAFQSADQAEVEILAPGQAASTTTTTTLPVTALADTGANGLPAQLIAGLLALGSGGLLLALGRRRNAG
jgi:LPXTG-motif cell wall-anchored protein